MTGFARGRAGRPPAALPATGRPTASRRTAACWQQELQGRSPAGGIEVRVMRKDGTSSTRACTSRPLIDAKGHQTGWMTSDDQHHRGQAHPRPALGVARALHDRARRRSTLRSRCCRCSSGELLFANRSYRLWFGATRAATALLAGGRRPAHPRARVATMTSTTFGGLPTQELTEAGPSPREVFVERCGSGSTCARATCSGSTAGWRRC